MTNFFRMRKALFGAALFFAFGASAQTDISTLNKAVQAARPGDTIVIANGTYRDAELVFVARGDTARPIVVRAETAGRVLFSGSSSLRIAGTGLEVDGLRFTAGFSPKGAAIEYRAGSDVANNCRITNCVIDNYDPPSRETESSWILLYGRHNRFDHNSVVGKLNNGVTLAVILDEVRNQDNGHRIDFNHFANRPNLGSNGGETIRVGTSQSSLTSSRTRIENNYFEQCSGEVEIVSIKSCDNIIRNNTFYESMGVLALRHGHRNLVEGNAFIGNGKPYTGGIRVINEGHVIRNNYFYRLAGDRFFAALAIMNAVPNSLPNRYHQVKDVTIANNTWVDCGNILLDVGKDNERTQTPENVLLSGNHFYNPASSTVYTAFDKIDGYRFENNRVTTKGGRFSQKGFIETKAAPVNPAVNAVVRAACGASWFTPSVASGRTLSGHTIRVARGQNSLANALATAAPGDVIELTDEGEYLLDKGVEIRQYQRVRAAAGMAGKSIVRYNGTKSKVALFTIADGGILELDGIAFNNEAFDGKAAAAAAISPAPAMRGHYSAWVTNCSFYNYQEASFSPFRAQRTTYADTLVFSGCLFRDMSGDAIYLSAEKEDAGKYSAEYVEVINCAFYKVLGYAVDLYRGGSDESTTGPTILVDHCVLEDVNNKERGSGMRLFGVQNATVRNSIFSNTGRGGASIRFDETHWHKISVSHCSLYNSGKIASFWGGVVTGPMYTVKPAYLSAATYRFSLQPGSPLTTKGTNGAPVGLASSQQTTSKR
jgi:poly(beta-D-mannuronate) lyase